ncbi:MAG: hypothetical protein HC876_14330 [Chloroflexaceae bacterium]|nr:hypothetical protein [Chloroflexaceae bacterium]NJO06595.1 hypothetical protein [Chloroflexaceae bacterium]NJO84399.1 hypothetical protein [Blastochloris sp.]
MSHPEEIRSSGVDERTMLFETLSRLAVSMQCLLGPLCEVVIHDFADFEHSIIAIEGNISNRSVGGSATDLLLEKASTGDTTEDLHSYLTSLPGGRLIKSSTIFLRDQHGQAFGAFCINLDITAFISLNRVINTLIATNDRNEVSELLSDNIPETIQSMVAETLYDAGKGLSVLSRDDKIELIARLHSRGVFKVKKAVPILADLLGLSRATVYNYLREARTDVPRNE